MLQNFQKYVIFLAISIVIFPMCGSSETNDVLAEIRSLLVREEFENIAVVEDDREILITYENRLYRSELTALEHILQILSSISFENDPQVITLISQHRQMPLIKTTLHLHQKKGMLDSLDVSLHVDSEWETLKSARKVKISNYQFDILAHIWYNAALGNFDDALRDRINFVPQFNIVAWKGISFSGQLITTLKDELKEKMQNDFRNENDTRLGRFVLNYTTRLPHTTFLSTTIGYFNGHRYGLDMEAKKYFFEGRWSIGTKFGYTGYAAYIDDTWHYTNIIENGSFTGFLSAAYRYAPLDLTLEMTYEKYLYDDKGWRFEMSRQFDEIEIGFFAMETGGGENAGFFFSIPIFPPKYYKTGPLVIRPARHFSWEYRARTRPWRGMRYYTGNEINNFIKQIHPDYIKNNLTPIQN